MWVSSLNYQKCHAAAAAISPPENTDFPYESVFAPPPPTLSGRRVDFFQFSAIWVFVGAIFPFPAPFKSIDVLKLGWVSFLRYIQTLEGPRFKSMLRNTSSAVRLRGAGIFGISGGRKAYSWPIHENTTEL